MTDNNKSSMEGARLVQMPTLEEFEAAGPVTQFLTKLLSNVVEELRLVEHRLECIENGGCVWTAPGQDEPIPPEVQQHSN